MLSNLFISLDHKTLFNASYFGIISQGKPSFDTETRTCHYLIQDNETIKCGVGHCLHDNLPAYVFEFEGDASSLISHYYELNGADVTSNTEIDEDTLNLLMNLQAAHDDAADNALSKALDTALNKAQVKMDNDVFLALFKENMIEAANEHGIFLC